MSQLKNDMNVSFNSTASRFNNGLKNLIIGGQNSLLGTVYKPKYDANIGPGEY